MANDPTRIYTLIYSYWSISCLPAYWNSLYINYLNYSTCISILCSWAICYVVSSDSETFHISVISSVEQIEFGHVICIHLVVWEFHMHTYKVIRSYRNQNNMYICNVYWVLVASGRHGGHRLPWVVTGCHKWPLDVKSVISCRSFCWQYKYIQMYVFFKQCWL